MAIKIQYNKTALQQLNKQLTIRLRALPTLKNKESALRFEVKKAKDEMTAAEETLQQQIADQAPNMALWNEFEELLLSVKEVKFSSKKIAGVLTPVIEDVLFDIADFSIFNKLAWYTDGIVVLKEIVKTAVIRDFCRIKMNILNYARKKTTQKVNLYEKVQIPEFENGIRKIKRFMEDEENLSKSAQKIVKSRQQKEEMAS